MHDICLKKSRVCCCFCFALHFVGSFVINESLICAAETEISCQTPLAFVTFCISSAKKWRPVNNYDLISCRTITIIIIISLLINYIFFVAKLTVIAKSVYRLWLIEEQNVTFKLSCNQDFSLFSPTNLNDALDKVIISSV